MELHDNLYALGLQLGREVFDDPESFRGALDDFLDEGDASTGDINLLVDAVRLGAFRSMVSILDSGADASRAIEEAGNRLARDRGSADVAGAQWACAVLGFAVGKVADADVRRYRTQSPGRSTQTPPVPPAAPTMLPSTPPTAGPPPAGPTAFPGTAGPGPSYGAPQTSGPGGPGGPSGVPPTQTPWSSQPQPGQPGGPAGPGWASVPPGPGGPGGPGGYGSSPAKKKSKVLPIVLAAVAVLLIGGIVATLLVVTGGDDGGDDEATPSKKDDESGETSTDFDAVNERYAALSSLITTGMDECTAEDTASGQKENLVCTFGDGELRLITYNAAPDLEAGRAREVDLKQIGGNYLDAGSGVVYGFKPDNDDTDTVDAPYLYWDDSEALQAARYQGNVGVGLDALVRTYRSTKPTIAYPEKPTDPELKTFAKNFVNVQTCNRVNTFTAGETEEWSCRGPAGVTPYFGKFDTIEDLKTYRRIKLGFAREDKTKNREWNLGGVKVGALYDYTIDDDGRAARYWDDPKCLCYGEAYQADGDATALDNWWSA